MTCTSAHRYGVERWRLARWCGWGEEDATGGLEGDLVAGPACLGQLRPHHIPEDALGGLLAIQQAADVGMRQHLRILCLHMPGPCLKDQAILTHGPSSWCSQSQSIQMAYTVASP